MFDRTWDKRFDDTFLSGGDSKEDSYHQEREKLMLAKAAQMFQDSNVEYRKSLLHPERHIGAKVPSELPNETATAQIKYNGTITPNSTGKFVFIIDPSIQDGSIYSDVTLNGTGTAGAATTVSFSQDSNIIDMFRLVSSSLIIQYTGRLDSHSGYVTGAITSNLSNATNTTFLTFTNIEDIQNKKVVMPVDGLKMIYTPYDTSQLDFYKQTDYSSLSSSTRWKKLFVVYGEGLPNTACIRFDYTRNIEYISKPAYREYVPHTVAPCCKLDNGILMDVKANEITNYDASKIPDWPSNLAPKSVWGVTPPSIPMNTLLSDTAKSILSNSDVQDAIKDQLKKGFKNFGKY